MLRVDGFYLYNVGSELRALADLSSGASGTTASSYDDAMLPLYVAEGVLEPLLRNSVFQLRTSVQAGDKLLVALRAAKAAVHAANDKSAPMRFDEVYEVTSALRAFENVLNAELALLPLYVVTQKAGYDTAILTEAGARCFPVDTAAKVPESISDLHQATRCIAFELFTAGGFHLHRANESVLHRYWDAVAGGKPRPVGRNMGDYLRELDANSVGDPKTKSALRDLKDLHRNPLIHPDDSIENLDDAIALMNGVHNAIARMLSEMPIVAPPPVVPAGGLPPP